jgi:hypothetical protein
MESGKYMLFSSLFTNIHPEPLLKSTYTAV